MSAPACVTAVLATPVAPPDTGCRPLRTDRALAQQLAAHRVPLQLVLDALRLARTRRNLPPGAPPKPVRPLHYFSPVVHELANVDPSVVAMLRESFQRRLNPGSERATTTPDS